MYPVTTIGQSLVYLQYISSRMQLEQTALRVLACTAKRPEELHAITRVRRKVSRSFPWLYPTLLGMHSGLGRGTEFGTRHHVPSLMIFHYIAAEVVGHPTLLTRASRCRVPKENRFYENLSISPHLAPSSSTLAPDRVSPAIVCEILLGKWARLSCTSDGRKWGGSPIFPPSSRKDVVVYPHEM